jgi:hypothetical protein
MQVSNIWKTWRILQALLVIAMEVKAVEQFKYCYLIFHKNYFISKCVFFEDLLPFIYWES